MKDRSCSWVLWCIVVILALALGLYAGHKVMKAISDVKIIDLQAQLETANTEAEFWKNILRSLADGNQLEGVDFKGKSTVGRPCN